MRTRLSGNSSKTLYILLVISTAVTIGYGFMAGTGTGTGLGSLTGGPDLRNVDLPKVLRMIQEGRLSDHEARFYGPWR